MSTPAEDFVGSWKIQWVSGNGPFKTGWYLELDEPIPQDDQILVGFTVFDVDGHVQHLETEAQGPLLLQYTGETLRWTGQFAGQPLYIFVSLAEVDSTKSIYGATVYGDPDQVGVWGGGAGTPPDPPPPPAG
jgi:hypothetical protein